MIEFVKNYCVGVVSIIVIASVIDALIPSEAMGKYVRLAVGLLVLLAVGSPILHMKNSDFYISKPLLSDNRRASLDIEQTREKIEELYKKQQEELERNDADDGNQGKNPGF